MLSLFFPLIARIASSTSSSGGSRTSIEATTFSFISSHTGVSPKAAKRSSWLILGEGREEGKGRGGAKGERHGKGGR